MRYRRRNIIKRRAILSFILLFSMVLLTGYAYLNKKLVIRGDTTVAKNTWKVEFQNIEVLENNAKVETAPYIYDNGSKVNFVINLEKPGDSYTFTVDVVNNGNIDAMLNTISLTDDLATKTNYLDYSLSYLDGIEFNQKDLLSAGSTDTIKFSVTFKKDITSSDLENEDTSLNLTLQQTYVQADDTAKEREHSPVCKKATTLHKTTCQYTSGTSGCLNSTTGYSSGSEITYGHTDSTKLVDGQLTNRTSVGYALDCDVTGAGKNYNQRFYYVSDMMYYDNGVKYDSDYATLIYYSNVKNKVANPTSTLAYYPSDENWHGASSTFMANMPTNTDWINTLKKDSNSNSYRQIVNDNGKTSATISGTTYDYPNYDYSAYGARLLTYQEVENGCGGTNDLNTNCEFLLENTIYEKNSGAYGYWLDTPSSNPKTVLYLDSIHRTAAYTSQTHVSNALGLRPAIEIAKSDILLQ